MANPRFAISNILIAPLKSFYFLSIFYLKKNKFWKIDFNYQFN